MGRYRAEGIIIRELDEVKIIFWDSQTIYVYDHAGRGIAFHRWFAPRGSYGEYWQAFRQRMMRGKGLTLAGCCGIATRYGVQTVGTYRKLDFEGRKVIKRK